MMTLTRIIIAALALCLLFGITFAKERERDNKTDARQQTSTAKTDASESTPAVTSPQPAPPPPSASPEAGEEINWWVIGAGGNAGTSTNYGLVGTVGQTSVVRGTSANYALQSGFWQDFGDGFVSCCVGRVGDANDSGTEEPTIGDISTMIDAKFITMSCVGLIDCPLEADVNQSGGITADCDDITIGDISMVIDYLFITGPTEYGPLNDCL